MKGIAISSGEAIAKPLVLEEVSFEDMLQIETEDVEQELKRFQVSRNHMKSYFQDLIRQRGASLSEEALAIIKIHLEFLDDPELVENTEELIREDQLCAESALIQNERMICQVLAEVEDEYIKERAADIKDVSKRILLDLQGVKGNDITILDQDVILVAEELEPSQLVAGDARHIKGIVCEKGGRTAHVAIIARSMSIPAVFGIDQAVEKLKEAENIYLHGSQGIVETNKTVEEQKNNSGQYCTCRCASERIRTFFKTARKDRRWTTYCNTCQHRWNCRCKKSEGSRSRRNWTVSNRIFIYGSIQNAIRRRTDGSL